jgi:hypothetical protein
MKVKVKESKSEKEIKFPCLMISEVTDVVAIFFDKEKGVSMNNKGGFNEPEYFTRFHYPNFKPFSGTITLSND